MDLNEKLMMRRKELGLTLEQVGDYIGVGKSTVRKWENGIIKDMKRSQIAKYAEILKIPPTVILGFDEDGYLQVPLPNPESVRTIPIYGALSCGTGLFVEDSVVDSISIPVSMLPNKSAEYFAQYAQGDSMIGAGIQDGDLIVFKKATTIENGQIGCFCIDENIATCKKYTKTATGIILLPANDKYEPIFIDMLNQSFKVVGVKVLLVSKEER